jgi:hypothetical protein
MMKLPPSLLDVSLSRVEGAVELVSPASRGGIGLNSDLADLEVVVPLREPVPIVVIVDGITVIMVTQFSATAFTSSYSDIFIGSEMIQ